MSRHRARPVGRLRRWLGLSKASLSAPLAVPSGPSLRLITPHLDVTPVEPEARLPFDGRRRGQNPGPSDIAPWTPPATAEAAVEPSTATAEPPQDTELEPTLTAFEVSVKALQKQLEDHAQAYPQSACPHCHTSVPAFSGQEGS